MSGCAFVKDWGFSPSRIERWYYRYRLEVGLRDLCLSPRSLVIKRVSPRDNWIIYFVYARDGGLSKSHVFTLERLRDTGVGVLVVCAAPSPGAVPSDLIRYADALYWKALPGYDFSAYSIALKEISRWSSGARVLVMNDSILGPFFDLKPFILRAPWNLTGFTASSEIENHIQSYAFILDRMTWGRMLALNAVFFPLVALNTRAAVVVCQETRFARAASRHMSVGSFLFLPQPRNPTLERPFDLLDRGHPFLKKSLLTRDRRFQDCDRVVGRLREYGHPIPVF